VLYAEVSGPASPAAAEVGVSGVIDIALYETTCLGVLHEQSGAGVVNPSNHSDAQALQFELAPPVGRRGAMRSLPNASCPAANERTRIHAKMP
jgi:hypothetical protein